MHQKGITESNPRKNTKSGMSYTCMYITFVFTGKLKRFDCLSIICTIQSNYDIYTTFIIIIIQIF